VAVAGAGEQQRTETQLRTHTVITTESNRQLSWLHDRMPVILDPGQVDVWLDSARYAFESPVIQKLLEPYAGTLDCYEVSTTVNSIKNNCRDCLLPLSEFKARQQAAGIGAFFSSPLRQSAARTLPWGCDGGTAGKEREEEGKEEGGNVEQDRSCAGKRTREKEVAEAQAANTSWSHTDSSWDSGGGNSGVRDSLQEEWRGQSAESQACSKARAEAHSGSRSGAVGVGRGLGTQGKKGTGRSVAKQSKQGTGRSVAKQSKQGRGARGVQGTLTSFFSGKDPAP